MPRHVFFSFHHSQDSWRVSQVRSKIGKAHDAANFLDAADWQKVEKRGPAAVKSWINKQLNGTSVTVVLIGEHTAERPYVLYEIEESYRRKNGLLGIYIHGIKNNKRQESPQGENPLDKISVEYSSAFSEFFGYKPRKTLSQIFKTYYWVRDNGRENMPKWIEEAAKIAGR